MLPTHREHRTTWPIWFGAAVWATLAILSGMRFAPLGVIELLFLYSPLVVVPLGFRLAGVVAPSGLHGLENVIALTQPIAAACAVASFFLSPGETSAILALPWLAICGLAGLSGVAGVVNRHHGLSAMIAGVARLDLVMGAGWLLVSRLGARPMGFQEPIVLLTAVHFHYSGFATALLAAAGLQFAELDGAPRTKRRVVAVSVAVLPFLLAAGFVLSPALRAGAACAFSLSVAALALLILRDTVRLHEVAARVLVALSAVSVLCGMALAATYAIGDYLHQDWLVIPQMASTHGVLNAFGFVLLGLLGWLIELQSRASKEEKYTSRDWRVPAQQSRNSLARTGSTRARSHYPRFAAREFYER